LKEHFASCTALGFPVTRAFLIPNWVSIYSFGNLRDRKQELFSRLGFLGLLTQLNGFAGQFTEDGLKTALANVC
jgi:hypothetical protein